MIVPHHEWVVLPWRSGVVKELLLNDLLYYLAPVGDRVHSGCIGRWDLF